MLNDLHSMDTVQSEQMQDKQMEASCEPTYLHCVHAPSDFLPFKVSRALPHQASGITVLMFYTHLQVLTESWSISGRWAAQGFAMCLFK